MLYYHDNITQSTHIGIWKLTETKDELIQMLPTNYDLSFLENIESSKRQLEKLATRVLLNIMEDSSCRINYQKSGSPFIKNSNSYISISHSKDYVSLAINKSKRIGIDIETISNRIYQIRDRILNEMEVIDPNKQDIHLTLHWCAKEATFKYLDTVNVSFQKDIIVDQFHPKKSGIFNILQTRTNNNQKLQAHYLIFNDFVLVCIE